MRNDLGIEELALDQAWELLDHNPDATLVDVRTVAEWKYVGVPELSSISKTVRLVEWTCFRDGAVNPDFVTEASEGLDLDQPVLLLCRSGVRSLSAAKALKEAGHTCTYSVAAGFEGDLDQNGHRHEGWKDYLPWKQS
ncbi:MAG: rhodanese-like domain-containing protein [Acidimicrobiales bacterium]